MKNKGKSHLRKDRWYVVYKILNPITYSIGLDVGYGDTKDEAKENFLFSRKDSTFKFKVLCISKSKDRAIQYQNKLDFLPKKKILITNH